MTWTTPPTFVNGELTAAQLNVLRDCLEDLDTRLRLHGMDSALVLGELVGSRYGVKVTRSSQSIPDATDQTIFWDTEVHDDDGFWSASQPGRVTIPADGTYVIKAWALYEADNGGAMRGLEIYVDGAGIAEDRVAHAGGSFQTSVRVDDELELTAGQEVYIRARHNAGHGVTINEATFTVRRVATTA